MIQLRFDDQKIIRFAAWKMELGRPKIPPKTLIQQALINLGACLAGPDEHRNLWRLNFVGDQAF